MIALIQRQYYCRLRFCCGCVWRLPDKVCVLCVPLFAMALTDVANSYTATCCLCDNRTGIYFCDVVRLLFVCWRFGFMIFFSSPYTTFCIVRCTKAARRRLVFYDIIRCIALWKMTFHSKACSGRCVVMKTDSARALRFSV